MAYGPIRKEGDSVRTPKASDLNYGLKGKFTEGIWLGCKCVY